MSSHAKYRYKNLADLKAAVDRMKLDIRFDTDLEPLHRRVRLGSSETPNSLAVHPLEGRDSLSDGGPSELTFRRYRRFASGGAGLIWFEATAVGPEGRAGSRQLLLNEANAGEFQALLTACRQLFVTANGASHEPVTVLQLTHSGRYSKPRPVLAVHDRTLDADQGIPPDYPLISDNELEALEDCFVQCAQLASRIGFPVVDIKACHGYLVSELLSAQTRPGRYGGSFENRTRFLMNVLDKIRTRVGSQLQLTVRLNAYDGIPHPHGWGTDQKDLTEPICLVKLLRDRGVRMVSISAGNPYHNPHIGRPFDTPVRAEAIPDEHPLEGVARLFSITRQIQEAVPGIVVVGTGYSWLRQYLGYAAAANIRNGWVTMVGVGREALAYPDFARDLLSKGILDPRKTCITCSRCSQLMRDRVQVGCVARDSAVYGPIYRSIRAAGKR